MKFLTYEYKIFGSRAGVLKDGNQVVDLTSLLKSREVIDDIGKLLDIYAMDSQRVVEEALRESPDIETLPLEEVRLLAPIAKPANIRDASVFERHVTNAGIHNGVGTPQKWYEKPLYYYHNTSIVVGPEAVIKRKPGSVTLDYEAEVALVVGKRVRDLQNEQAVLDCIFGLTIFNDWSDRASCSYEVGFLGLHHGKDSANGFGPYIVTFDEFMPKYNKGILTLKVDAYVNDIHTTDSLTDDMYYTLAQLMMYISADSTIDAGDIIGLGTVGTGCIYERPDELLYLRDGDTVQITVEGIGSLRQYVAK